MGEADTSFWVFKKRKFKKITYPLKAAVYDMIRPVGAIYARPLEQSVAAVQARGTWNALIRRFLLGPCSTTHCDETEIEAHFDGRSRRFKVAEYNPNAPV